MDIERFREFITLAECLNYSKAAQQLFMTQPVLSRHIHDLENNVGAQLLVRDTHRVELTPIGRIFYNEAQIVVGDYDQAVKKVTDAANGTIGNLRIGFLSAAVEPFLRDFALRFRQEEPSIGLDYVAMELDEVLQAVKTNQVDVGFATHITSEEEDLHIEEIFTDSLCVAVSKDNPLSKEGTLTTEQLSGVPLVLLNKDQNYTTYRFNERLFLNHKAEFNVVQSVPNIDTGLFFASMNIGVFILPEHLGHWVNRKTMNLLKILDEDSKIHLNIIYKKDNMNPVTSIFCDAFMKFGKSHAQNEFH